MGISKMPPFKIFYYASAVVALACIAVGLSLIYWPAAPLVVGLLLWAEVIKFGEVVPPATRSFK